MGNCRNDELWGDGQFDQLHHRPKDSTRHPPVEMADRSRRVPRMQDYVSYLALAFLRDAGSAVFYSILSPPILRACSRACWSGASVSGHPGIRKVASEVARAFLARFRGTHSPSRERGNSLTI